jgi:energy-coupling factor transport system permease protein
MDARCYQGGKGKTKLHPLRLKGSDVLWTLILVVVAFIPLAVDLLQNLK